MYHSPHIRSRKYTFHIRQGKVLSTCWCSFTVRTDNVLRRLQDLSSSWRQESQLKLSSCEHNHIPQKWRRGYIFSEKFIARVTNLPTRDSLFLDTRSATASGIFKCHNLHHRVWLNKWIEQRWMVLLWDNRCRPQDYSHWRHSFEDRDKMKSNLSLFHIQNTQCHRQAASVSLGAEQLRPLLPFLPHTFQSHFESHWQTVQLLNEKSIIFGKIKTLDQVYFYTSRSCSKTRSSLW
jgi:hypothetical protein